MSLDQVASSRPGASANQCTSLPTDESASKQPYRTPDECSLRSAVVSTTTVVPLRVYIEGFECTHQQNDGKQCS
jgi:hypothetical protein